MGHGPSPGADPQRHHRSYGGRAILRDNWGNFDELAFAEEKYTLTVEVDEKAGVNYWIEFKGSLKDVSLDFEPVDDLVDNKGPAHPVAGYLTQESVWHPRR